MESSLPSGPLIPLLRPGALPDRDSWTGLQLSSGIWQESPSQQSGVRGSGITQQAECEHSWLTLAYTISALYSFYRVRADWREQ